MTPLSTPTYMPSLGQLFLVAMLRVRWLGILISIRWRTWPRHCAVLVLLGAFPLRPRPDKEMPLVC